MDGLARSELVEHTLRWKNSLVIGLVVLLLVLFLAYLDGGEEPVQPMRQTVAVPQWSFNERIGAMKLAEAIVVRGPF